MTQLYPSHLLLTPRTRKRLPQERLRSNGQASRVLSPALADFPVPIRLTSSKSASGPRVQQPNRCLAGAGNLCGQGKHRETEQFRGELLCGGSAHISSNQAPATTKFFIFCNFHEPRNHPNLYNALVAQKTESKAAPRF